jgi:hypothetical protein
MAPHGYAGGGKELETSPGEGLPFAAELDFVDEQVGWARTTTEGCRGFKTDCYSVTALFKSADAGETWSQIRF